MKPGTSTKRQQRDVEAVAGPHESRGLRRRVDVQRAGEDRGLLSDDADAAAAQSRESRDDVLRPARLDLEEVTVVDDPLDDAVHVVRLGRIVGDDRIERDVAAVGWVARLGAWGIAEVVLRQEAQDAACRDEGLGLIVGGKMGDTADRRVRGRPAQPLGIDFLVGDRLHDIRPGDEHVARALDHDREVGDRRRIHRAPGTRAHDHRDLWHDAGGQRVAQEDVRVATERHDSFLDPRASRIVEPDDRRTDLHRQIHHLADLLGVRLGQRSTEDREVLAEDEHGPTIDGAVTRDDPIAEERGLRLGVAIRDERIELDERAGVQQQLQPLPRGEFSTSMLLIDAFLSPTETSLRSQGIEPRQSIFIRRHGRRPPAGNAVFVQGQSSSYVPSYPPKW